MRASTKLACVLPAIMATVPAIALDKSAQLLCATVDAYECVDGRGCQEVLPEAVNLPAFLRIDLRKKEISTSEDRASMIEHLDTLEGRTILQGAEPGSDERADGGGWTLTIDEETARFTGTMTADHAALVIFGACTDQ
ncbi:MAG: hypothetical protein ACR2P1_07830 [Pseudomonadales bacterium]